MCGWGWGVCVCVDWGGGTNQFSTDFQTILSKQTEPAASLQDVSVHSFQQVFVGNETKWLLFCSCLLFFIFKYIHIYLLLTHI